MTKHATLPLLAAVATLSLGACAAYPPARVGAPPPANYALMRSGDCFISTDWQGWASPSDDALFLRVRNNRIYRVDLLPGSGPLDRGGQFLISNVHGSGRICTANDLDLKIASANGFSTPLFPRAIRRLTAAEVAALPPNAKP